MEQRIHSSKSTKLTYWHYLIHFKWPLFGFFSVLLFIIFVPLNMTSGVLPHSDEEKLAEFVKINAIYPTNFANKTTNIKDYFIKKDQLKINDDAEAMKRNFKIVLPWNNDQHQSKSYIILEYTNVFGKPKFCSLTNEEIFGRFCPYTNCKYVCNETYEKEADVLLMHKRDLNYQKLDQMTRDPEQIWLLWHDESNEISPEINKYKFNWTITYRTSAEASIGAYGITILKRNPWSLEQFNSWIDEQFVQRANQAVWFVSNCAPTKRLQRFRSLRQHFPIVAFGKCIPSNETQSLNARLRNQSSCDRQSSCEKEYLTTSKFYLAFESQTCTDYITEKFWRTLALGAIPIVSGPNQQDFLRVAPPYSFIHIDDYESDEELAHTLSLISTKKEFFETYHSWRRYYDVYYQAQDVEPYRFCELCYRLNTNRQRIWYENLNNWFLDQC